ncbi:MAG: hypothetical protein AB8E15_11215 [Bdellovibrionales bacterium]
MKDLQANFLHDLTNKLTIIDGKLKRVDRCESVTEIKMLINKLRAQSKEALDILKDFKESLEDR